MNKVLLIQTSPKGTDSMSRKAGRLLIEQLQKKSPSEIIERDLAKESLPHIDGLAVSAFYTPPEAQTLEQKKAVALSDQLVSEVLTADSIIITTPMWNFGPPSVLKAWIDHIVRASKTFTFTEKGLQGLLAGKKVYVVASSGSVFSTGPFSTYDHLTTYFQAVFGFMGVTDVKIIRVEGTNDPTAASKALTSAVELIQAL